MISTRYLFLDANVIDRYLIQLQISVLMQLLFDKLPDTKLIVCTELLNEITDVCTRP